MSSRGLPGGEAASDQEGDWCLAVDGLGLVSLAERTFVAGTSVTPSLGIVMPRSQD